MLHIRTKPFTKTQCPVTSEEKIHTFEDQNWPTQDDPSTNPLWMRLILPITGSSIIAGTIAAFGLPLILFTIAATVISGAHPTDDPLTLASYLETPISDGATLSDIETAAVTDVRTLSDLAAPITDLDGLAPTKKQINETLANIQQINSEQIRDTYRTKGYMRLNTFSLIQTPSSVPKIVMTTQLTANSEILNTYNNRFKHYLERNPHISWENQTQHCTFSKISTHNFMLERQAFFSCIVQTSFRLH